MKEPIINKARVAYADTETNDGKLARLDALARVYHLYVQECIGTMVAARTCFVLIGSRKNVFAPSTMTSHLQKCARAQAVKTMSTWAMGEYALRVRSEINKLDLPREEKTALYTIGKRCIVSPQPYGKYEITQAQLDQYWSLFWDGVTSTPSIGDTYPLVLSQDCVVFGESEQSNAFGFWIEISSLEPYERIRVPLRIPPAMLAAAKLAKTVSIRKDNLGRLGFTFFDKAPTAPMDGSAGTVAVDVGLNVLAATSDGRLFGRDTKPRFDRKYKVLRETRRNRMRQGLYEDSKRQTRREKTLTAMVKTETGAVVNQLVKAYPNHTFVVEDLDLRGCKGQKRFAYRALQKNLAAKAVTMPVNPAYTSQECPSCHNPTRKNRNGTKFQCVSCGRISHADVVGAINLLGRSEDKQIGLETDAYVVKAILRARYLSNRNSVVGRVGTSPCRRTGCSLQSSKDGLHSVELGCGQYDHVLKSGACTRTACQVVSLLSSTA